MRQPTDGAEHVLHRRRLAEEFGCLVLRLVGLLLAQAFIDRALDQFDGLVHVERLAQVIERPALQRRHRTVQVGIRCHDDDRQAGVRLPDLLQQLDAVPTRHADVADQHLRAEVVQSRQHVARIGKAADFQPGFLKRLFQHEADRGIVIDDPDRLHRTAPLCRWPLLRATVW
ncbi:hypothetical protein GALL_493560 [mine drainage metagenome]|uniref:Uncharacterized protein n=1 Tax=mine drainage metagenome TaxID=410659 RepID=A0A1J5PCJ1_9ZZZZ